MDIRQLAIGFIFGIGIAWLAYRARSLSKNGAVAASLVGGFIFGLGGFPWAVMLLVFFVSSSALSKVFTRRKAALDEKFAKGSQRDWEQVTANGGLGTLLAMVFVLFPTQNWVWAAFVGAMAAVNADTWATEIGVLNPQPPRLITNGAVVERGASGGVSFYGYLAVIGGAILIGASALVFTADVSWWVVPLAALAGGMAGASLDSFLGATVQAIYYCPVCAKETEKHPQHSCGASTHFLRGWRWVSNEVVNFACSLGGAVVAVGVWWLFS
jgi:uncharacterized protein (TIGR00297 family)